MTTKQQVEKANESACVSVALHERPTIWDYRPETKTYFNSQTGEPIKDVSHWIYESNKYICLVPNRDDAAKTAQRIILAVNLLPEVIELLESYSGIDDCRSQSLFGDKLDELLEKAKSI